MSRKIFIFLLMTLGLATMAHSQETAPKSKVIPQYKPLRVNISEDGSHYFRIITWLQMWVKLTDNNPGTIGLDNQPRYSSTDIGIRRSRFLIYAQMGPRFLILTHFGINNQAFNTGGFTPSVDGKKPQLYIHDAWTEYTLVPKYLSLGLGLHYWNGVSRAASASTLNFMTLDAPIFNWFTIETNDQFARQLGIYAKGQIRRLDYRISFNQPFINGVNAYTQSARTSNGYNTELASKNAFTNTWAQTGYFKFMLKDPEVNLLPYENGTYLGTKKVFNIGAGFYHHPDANYTLEPGVSDSLKFHSTTVFGADLFYDAPLGTRGYAISTYFLLQNMNFGDNYLRNVGVMNTSTVIGNAAQLGDEYANRSVMGAGNLQPTIGTGTILFLEAGLKFPNFTNGTALMPYLTVTNKSFDAINNPSVQFDLGINYFISGHNAKITLQYGTRPVYKYDTASSNGISQNGQKGQLTFQTHIFL